MKFIARIFAVFLLFVVFYGTVGIIESFAADRTHYYPRGIHHEHGYNVHEYDVWRPSYRQHHNTVVIREQIILDPFGNVLLPRPVIVVEKKRHNTSRDYRPKYYKGDRRGNQH